MWKKGWLPRTWMKKQTLQPNGTHIIDKKLQGRSRIFHNGPRDHGQTERRKISVQEIQVEA